MIPTGVQEILGSNVDRVAGSYSFHLTLLFCLLLGEFRGYALK